MSTQQDDSIMWLQTTRYIRFNEGIKNVLTMSSLPLFLTERMVETICRIEKERKNKGFNFVAATSEC